MRLPRRIDNKDLPTGTWSAGLRAVVQIGSSEAFGDPRPRFVLQWLVKADGDDAFIHAQVYVKGSPELRQAALALSCQPQVCDPKEIVGKSCKVEVVVTEGRRSITQHLPLLQGMTPMVVPDPVVWMPPKAEMAALLDLDLPPAIRSMLMQATFECQ